MSEAKYNRVLLKLSGEALAGDQKTGVNAKVVGEDGNIECPTLLFSSNGKDQEIDWVLNQQKFAEIMGAKLISYDCEHYIHHFKSDEMSEEIFRFVNSFIL